MELTNIQVERIVGSVALRFGITGFVSAHQPANRDNVLVIQVRGNPDYEFQMDGDATEEVLIRKAEAIFTTQQS